MPILLLILLTNVKFSEEIIKIHKEKSTIILRIEIYGHRGRRYNSVVQYLSDKCDKCDKCEVVGSISGTIYIFFSQKRNIAQLTF